MTVNDEEIRQITEAVWLATLGLPVAPEAAEFDGAAKLTGVVQISGSWAGAVAVDCSAGLARRAAAVMFGMAEADLADEEILDALGELTNMTGGNIKTLIEGSCALSLPAVTEGRSYRMSIPGTTVLNSVGFQCDGEPLSVTVLQRRAA